jgi:hypothetical protein
VLLLLLLLLLVLMRCECVLCVNSVEAQGWFLLVCMACPKFHVCAVVRVDYLHRLV